MARLKALSIPLDIFVAAFREPGMTIETTHHPLPADTMVAGAYVNQAYRVLVLHLHSASFEDMPVGFQPEEIEPPAVHFKSAEYRQKEREK